MKQVSFQKGINTTPNSVMCEIFAPPFRVILEVGKYVEFWVGRRKLC